LGLLLVFNPEQLGAYVSSGCIHYTTARQNQQQKEPTRWPAQIDKK